jgi:hypothetical protein
MLAGCPKTTRPENGWVEDQASEWQSYRATDRYGGQKITVRAIALLLSKAPLNWTASRKGSGADRRGLDPTFFAVHFARTIRDPLVTR